MAKITKIPEGAMEMGGRVYDTTTACNRCMNIIDHPDGLGHCVYRIEGFDPNRVIVCGNKWTDKQKRL